MDGQPEQYPIGEGMDGRPEQYQKSIPPLPPLPSKRNVSLRKMQNPYAKEWNGSDIIVTVEEEEFHIHSFILGLASPVFEAMFKPHFKEGLEKKVDLPGKNKNSLLQMLRLIYPDSDYCLNDYSDFYGLLCLAREYGIVKVRKLVDQYLFNRNRLIEQQIQNQKWFEELDMKNTVTDLRLAEEFDLPFTRDYCIRNLVEVRNTTIFKDRAFQELPSNIRLKILQTKLSRFFQRQPYEDGYCKYSMAESHVRMLKDLTIQNHCEDSDADDAG